MAEGSVSERRLRPIQEAAANRNWRQALQLCEKWSKKGEKSDQFLALKATMLLKQPDTAQHERGKQEIVQLCKREPAITNVDALQQIQDALRDLSLHTQEGPKLWERAIVKDPLNRDLLMTWLHSSIAESNWLSAQKAAVALQKASPKERKYNFWKTLFGYLIQDDPTLENNQRKLFGTLAYRFISKAAETVPEDKDQLLSSPEAIQTPEELGLLVIIYLATDRAAEAVKLLSSNILGVSSRFAVEDPGLVLQLLLKCFEEAQNWSEAFDFCKQQLESQDTTDPTLWEFISSALRKAQYSPELVDRAQAMASSRMRTVPNDRSGQMLALSIAKHDGSSGSRLSDVCQQYYETFKSKAFCFDDLREPFSRLGEHERVHLLDVIAKDGMAANPHERLLVMKFDFCFQPGLQESRQDLERLAGAALDLYDSCRKNSTACPETGYLAAVALVKIAQLQNQSQSDDKSVHCEVLLQAAMLLEHFQQDQKHGEEYYPYLILLIRVQQMLGLMAMALFNCKKLSVKNIQFESVGYFLLERISTLHPRQVGKTTPNEDGGFSPLEQLDLALDMLDRSESTLTRQIHAGLDVGTYPNITQAVKTRSDLKRSINREVFAYEHLKTRRLTGMLDEGGHPIPHYTLVDQRDISFLQTYEISGHTPVRHLQLGPLTKEGWLDAMSLYDKLFFYLRNKLRGSSALDDKAIGLLESALQKIDERSENEMRLQLTNAEADNVAIHKTLGIIVVRSGNSNTQNPTRLDDYLHQLELWLESKLAPQEGCINIRGILVPGWEYLHASFTALETIQVISLFLSAASNKTSPRSGPLARALAIPKETLSKLQSLVNQAEAAIHQQARDVKKGLNEEGVLGRLVDIIAGKVESNCDEQSEIGAAIERQGDAVRQETFCGEMKESWEDAVDGILACKIKVMK